MGGGGGVGSAPSYYQPTPQDMQTTYASANIQKRQQLLAMGPQEYSMETSKIDPSSGAVTKLGTTEDQGSKVS